MTKKKAKHREWASLFSVSKSASNLLVLFIPSHDRHDRAVDQNLWIQRALGLLGRTFGAATAFPRGLGVYRDDKQGGKLLFDEPVVIHCYTTEAALEEHAPALREFLVDLGSKCNQAAVGWVIDRDYLEIQFERQARGG